ncbi:putative HTH-type transcriptional regulator [ANME-1 cluster archaeon GoMg1]|nr:putative HTH-type transcriptional regulator [ANME-1 cluster archaeon GoMg1]
MNVEEHCTLDNWGKELLQHLQDEFPVAKSPWAEIGEKLGITEEEVLSRSQRLFSEGVIRKLRTILDAQKLGACSSTLMAMRVPAEKMEEVVNIVNEYMSVTHNYQREHDYNLWFTVTTCGGKDLRSTVEEIKERTGIPDSDTLDLPTTRVFKIDVRFKFADFKDNSDSEGNDKGIPKVEMERTKMNTDDEPDETDQTILRAAQEGIPVVKEPFEGIAKEAGISQDEVIERLKKLIKGGVIKRLGISINQRKVGIVANAVVAWKVPQGQVENVGKKLSSYTDITHCYERVAMPGKWEHNLFTVIHGYTRESVEEMAERLSRVVGIGDFLVLFSNEQFKRTSVMHPY